MTVRDSLRRIWRGFEAFDAGFEYEEQADIRLRVERLEKLVANHTTHIHETGCSYEPDHGHVGRDSGGSAKAGAPVDQRETPP